MAVEQQKLKFDFSTSPYVSYKNRIKIFEKPEITNHLELERAQFSP